LAWSFLRFKPFFHLEDTMLNLTNMQSDKKLLTLEEIAKTLRVSKRTVVRWVQQGVLSAYRIGTVIRVPEDAFEKMLQQHWTESTEEN
jgi:excisionase family DNA binding protein